MIRGDDNERAVVKTRVLQALDELADQPVNESGLQELLLIVLCDRPRLVPAPAAFALTRGVDGGLVLPIAGQHAVRVMGNKRVEKVERRLRIGSFDAGDETPHCPCAAWVWSARRVRLWPRQVRCFGPIRRAVVSKPRPGLRRLR